MVRRAGEIAMKRRRKIENLRSYKDHDIRARGEPDQSHSFIASLAIVLSQAGYVIDPVWLTGASGFAFRIWVQGRLQPNAMNAFDWEALLAPSVERTGFSCTHIYRATGDEANEENRRIEAHAAIVESIDRGVPAIVWDPTDPPVWSLVCGYNDFTRTYDVFATWGYHTSLSYAQLGRRDVATLSVTVVGEPNGLAEAAAFRESLEIAVAHAEEREQPSRPRLAAGLSAYDCWADLLEPGALPVHDLQFADYYGGSYCTARCYARDYLRRFGGNDPRLKQASGAYADVAGELLTVWRTFDQEKRPCDAVLRELSQCVRRARVAEEAAIDAIGRYLRAVTG